MPERCSPHNFENSEALEMILSPDCPDDVDLEDENFMDTY